MNNLVVDSCVVAKWILPEPDAAQAHQVSAATVAAGGRFLILDLALVEVTNVIWKRQRQKAISPDKADHALDTLLRLPCGIEPAVPLLPIALKIANKFNVAVYDALFVALANQRGLRGVTADAPLVKVINSDYPEIILLRDFK